MRRGARRGVHPSRIGRNWGSIFANASNTLCKFSANSPELCWWYTNISRRGANFRFLDSVLCVRILPGASRPPIGRFWLLSLQGWLTSPLFFSHTHPHQRRNPDRLLSLLARISYIRLSNCRERLVTWRRGREGLRLIFGRRQSRLEINEGEFFFDALTVIKIARGSVKDGCWKLILKFWSPCATAATHSTVKYTFTWRFFYYFLT